jgi:hypothetical protein
MTTRTALLLSFAALLACQSDGRSSGYHSPNLTYGGGDLALAWLNNQPGREEVMFVRADPQTAQPRGRSIAISKSARGSDPPLLAWDGERWRVMWTNERGISTVTVDPRGRVRGEQRIVDGKARLCPQLVLAGGALVLAWHDEMVLHVAKVSGTEHGATISEPMFEMASPAFGACALANKGTDLAIAWADDRAAADDSLHMMVVALDGKVIADRALSTTPRAASAAVAVAAEQSGWAIAYASADAQGFELARVDASLADRSRVRSPDGAGFVRGVGLASAVRSLSFWAEVPSQDDRVGSAFFAAPRPDGALDPRPIGDAGRVRRVVNAIAVGETFALTWADNKNGGTINWGILRPRGNAEHLDAIAEISAAL